MKSLFLPKNRFYRKFSFLILAFGFGLVLTITPASFPQTEESFPAPQSSPTTATPSDGLYFADVLVRGRPVFEIGSLAEVSASDRADIINRRIASVLAQSGEIGQVTVKPDNPRNIATLQVNNRVLMTITEQDAQDFGLGLCQSCALFRFHLGAANGRGFQY
jgi:small conductance mechanosensitive channel